MKDTEAREILGMLKAATTQYSLDDEAVAFWLDALSVLDAEIATKAVLNGINDWKRFPSWADFKEAYSIVKRQMEAASRKTQVELLGKVGVPPQWVWVWVWAHFHRDPLDRRFFPQQEGWADPDDTMSMQDYERLRDEWIARGSPKLPSPLPIGETHE